jgi:hypothetical protein
LALTRFTSRVRRSSSPAPLIAEVATIDGDFSPSALSSRVRSLTQLLRCSSVSLSAWFSANTITDECDANGLM